MQLTYQYLATNPRSPLIGKMNVLGNVDAGILAEFLS
jgi:hypothetical protein